MAGQRCYNCAVESRLRLLRGVVLVGLLCAPLRGRAQLQQNEYQQQQDYAAKFEPAPLLAPGRPGGGPSGLVRLRFYADDEFRSSSGGGRWQDRVRGQLLSLNQVVEPTFGIRFEGESFRRWERTGKGGALQPMLEELEKLDKGPDVDWVVGLVSPLPLVSMSFHDLGCARVLGRHFVLRGMASIAELDDFKRVLPKLDQEDREKLYSRRKLHKELSIFLHEWAHTLGALHVEDGTRIMGPGYSNRTSLFSAEDAGLIAAGLDARMAARGKETIDWTPLRKLVTDAKGDWVKADRAQLMELLQGSQARAEAGGEIRSGAHLADSGAGTSGRGAGAAAAGAARDRAGGGGAQADGARAAHGRRADAGERGARGRRAGGGGGHGRGAATAGASAGWQGVCAGGRGGAGLRGGCRGGAAAHAGGEAGGGAGGGGARVEEIRGGAGVAGGAV